MFGFFQVQVAVSIFLLVAFTVSGYCPDSPGVVVVTIATTSWLIAVAGEALADQQLRSFAADPANRGKACQAGLWRYSRHPNYSSECMYWPAYVSLALDTL